MKLFRNTELSGVHSGPPLFKEINVNNDYTDITVVLDRSGSMQSIKSDVEGGFDAFIKKQRELPGLCKVTLHQFDTLHDTVYTAVAVQAVEKLNLEPRGGTALYDALGRAINSTGARLRTMDPERRPGKVLFVVITDGMENASREFTRETVKAMVKEQTSKYSWDFMYLGANQDAVFTAEGLGILATKAATFGYSGAGAAAAFTATANYVTASRGAADIVSFQSNSINALDRKSLADTVAKQ